MFNSGAKLVMLNAQKMVLIFCASDSFRNAVGSALSAAAEPSEVEPPSEPDELPEAEPAESPVLYKSLTTASDFGCTTIFEPYVLSSALSLSPTSNTTPSMATLTVAGQAHG